MQQIYENPMKFQIYHKSMNNVSLNMNDVQKRGKCGR